MINLPRRGSARKLGLTLRWTIGCPTIADFDGVQHGGLFAKLRLLRRIRRAGVVARILCAREISADIVKQIEACAFPATTSTGAPGGPAGGGIDPLIQRYALEVTRCTGMSPREQYDKLTPLEWSRLLSHCAWVQGREDAFFASMTSRQVIGKYPDMRDPDSDREDRSERIGDILSAWAGTTRH